MIWRPLRPSPTLLRTRRNEDETDLDGIQLAFSALGGFIGWFLGGADGFLYALIAFVVVDYITGIMCAIADKNLSSAVGFKGICRKVLIFVLVGVGNLVDVYVLGQGGVLRTAVIFFYLSNEGISFLENADTWACHRGKAERRAGTAS